MQAVVPQPVAQPAAQQAEEPAKVTAAAPVPKADEVPEQAPVTTPASEQVPAPATPSASAPVSAPARRSGVIPGGSLASLLNRVSGGADGEASSAVTKVDPESERKLTAAREEIVRSMCQQRPRFIVAFESIRFEGNKICLVAPTMALRDELLLSRRDIVENIAVIAEVDGALDLDVEVREVKVRMRPVKLEDRVRHIQSKAPLFDEFRKAFDLDVE